LPLDHVDRAYIVTILGVSISTEKFSTIIFCRFGDIISSKNYV
jgi:hypothetical protein